MASYFVSLGGEIKTGFFVNDFSELPSANVYLFDSGPKQLAKIAGKNFSTSYLKELQKFKYGPGIFKVDWILNSPVPFKSKDCLKAGTLHLGGTSKEIIEAENSIWQNKHPEKPFVLLAQQSLFDNTRTPSGKHIAWGYCHVPSGSTVDMTEKIEKQVERFAPGFKDCITDKHTMNSLQYEEYNPNLVGGDITGGIQNLRQLYTRPSIRLSPYTTPAKNIYICSASTPPGGGVHGMCGYHAAKTALKNIFNIKVEL
jgi:phytoene dehydrogenase-like protein